MARQTLEERINKYIIKSKEGCWLWCGAANKHQKIISDKGKTYSVKRLLFQWKNPELSTSGYLHQICKDKACVNPDHLMNRDGYFETLICKNITNGCWDWLGEQKGGYGFFSIDHKNKLVHRLMYIRYKGEIPNGMNVCHSCDRPICVNPDHLWIGSQFDNVMDMMGKKRDKKLRGESHAHASITEEDARNIKIKKKEGMNMREIHRALNISYRVVQHICSGDTWKHVVI
jgi:hypothetical protein